MLSQFITNKDLLTKNVYVIKSLKEVLMFFEALYCFSGSPAVALNDQKISIYNKGLRKPFCKPVRGRDMNRPWCLRPILQTCH